MILKLNKNYMPCGGTNNIEDVFGKLYNGTYQAIEATVDENGDFETFIPHLTWESWLSKEIPEGAKTVRTPSMVIEIPSIVVCTKYDKIPKIDAGIPTKEKIYERDDYTCVYTGRRLKRRDLSIDHVHPTSLGGSQSEWENMVTCDKRINHLKSNYILGQIPRDILTKMGVTELKLRYQPFKPKFRKMGYDMDDVQRIFVDKKK